MSRQVSAKLGRYRDQAAVWTMKILGFDSAVEICTSSTDSRPAAQLRGQLGGLPPRIIWSGHATDQSRPSGAKVKNAWSCNSTAPFTRARCLITQREELT